jgi:FRG domain
MQTPNDIHVSSWNELNDQVFADSWHTSLQRFRTRYVFRGLSDASYDLRTSLTRLGGPYDKLENVVLRTFKKYAHQNASPGESVWNWLAVAQHHGLPTRLLDWTFSPFVAFHFATSKLDQYERDAAVWCINIRKLHDWLPQSLVTILNEENAIGFSVDMLKRAANSLEEFDHLADEPFVIFLDPPSLDERIVNQSASFSMMSSPTAILHEWLLDKPDLYRRIIVPASLKWEIRDKLDDLNITERVLFPGLDGLSSWITRYYSPRNP